MLINVCRFCSCNKKKKNLFNCLVHIFLVCLYYALDKIINKQTSFLNLSVMKQHYYFSLSSKVQSFNIGTWSTHLSCDRSQGNIYTEIMHLGWYQQDLRTYWERMEQDTDTTQNCAKVSFRSRLQFSHKLI